ncbi:amidohydrolase family protein [Fusibacter tunisiensis]|uniref:Cytosine/adenosine deaminase-related metal-dependent hydrolase n=1 Tax=Fusibacter tunisiensis TaxID=1008308 RepID=A0ABS2MQN7_9FIRM|nr:amidohydrolase family protein [Fusibacter tunisiensis]MBM7561727.1 cytosine/adenosine deaminase-related metal-dependent hydrolase [Fusibacter tunisiensis]
MTAIINARLYDYVTYIESGYVCFEETIQEVGPMENFKGADSIIDAKGMLILPGFINFHTHAYSVFATGFDFKASPKSFTDILEQIWWRMDRILECEDLYHSAIYYGACSAQDGVLGIVDHNASGAIKGALESVKRGFDEVGVYGTTCFETSDRYQVEACLTENENFIRKGQPYFGLHASMTLSDKTLGAVRSRLNGGLIHVHVSESIDDQNRYTETPIQRLNRHGLLKPDSLLVHGVHLSHADYQRIRDHECVLALAPKSNLNNGVGTVDFKELIENDIQILAGTDGLGTDVANSWLWIYYLANNQLGGLSPDFLRNAIEKSYLYYERVTGRKTGRFKTGYRMDLILVNYNPATPIDSESIFAHLLYGVFEKMDVQKAWVNGNQIVDKGRLTHSYLEASKNAVHVIWDKLGGKHV